MTRKSKRTFLSLILSMMLIVAMAFSMTACGGNKTEKPNTGTEAAVGDGIEQSDEDSQVELL